MADQAEQLRALMQRMGSGGRGQGPGEDSSPTPDPRSPAPTRVIAISSGKGGVGKTNVTVNLAIALGQSGRRVVVMDGDLGLANVDVVLGISPRFTLAHVIQGSRSLDEVVVDGPPNVRVVPGGSGLRELANMSEAQRRSLIRALVRVSAGADYLLLDTAAGVSDDVSEFVLAAQEVLVVTTPDPTAITDAYALIKVVTQEPLHPLVHLVVNQVSSEAEANDVALKIGTVASRFLKVSIDSLGYLPADSALVQAVRRQTPVLVAYPRCAFSRRVYALCRQIDGRPPVEPARADGVVGFLRRMTRGAGF